MKLSIGLMMFLATAPFFSAHAIGGVDGGGGIGVRCAKPATKATFELLDLHEARFRKTEIPHEPKTQEEAIALTAELFTKHYWNPSSIPKEEFKELFASSIVRPIFEGRPFEDFETGKPINVEFGEALPLSNDIGKHRIQPYCRLEQVAYFSDKDRTLRISKFHWNSLDWVDRSALVAHELVYFVDRKDGLENVGSIKKKLTSERARLFVGQLYSQKGVRPRAASIPERGFSDCGDQSASLEDMTYFYAFSEKPNSTTAVFNVVHGRSSPYQLKAVLPDTDLASLQDIDNGEVKTKARLQFVDEPNAPRIVVDVTKAKGERPKLQASVQLLGRWVPVGAPVTFLCFPNK